MRDLLFVSHSTPAPPDKGEKIRAFNVIRHLARTHRIHLGCLMDQPTDAAHLETLRPWCATVAGFPIDRRRQKLSALARIRPGRPLMLDYYRQPALHAWVRATLAAMPVACAYVYTVAMMPYLDTWRGPGLVLDAIDIDSQKWTTYAETAGFPMRLVWGREGRTLLAYERRAAARADATLFVSPNETARFAELAPELAGRLHAVENGVDLDRFSAAHAGQTPFGDAGPNLVFTGHMDYWPNADAVTWFADHVLPALLTRHPTLRFHVVGASPGPAIRALAARPGITVTGRVPDVRPFLAHADLCVAPLRIARGIQNKVLEAMAMGRPTLASPEAFTGIRAQPGRDLLVADGAVAMVGAAEAMLAGAYPTMGGAARACVERAYAWDATLSGLDAILAATAPACDTTVT